MLKKSAAAAHKSGLMYVDFVEIVDVLKIQYVKKSQPGVRYYQWRPSNSLNTGSSSRYLLNGPGQRRQSVTFYQAASYFNVFSPGSRLSLDQALLLGADLSWPWVVGGQTCRLCLRLTMDGINITIFREEKASISGSIQQKEGHNICIFWVLSSLF